MEMIAGLVKFRLAFIANDGDDSFGRDAVFLSAMRANNYQF